MKKGILSLLTWCLPFLVFAQTDTSHGINWTTGLSWEQVKQKAKAVNKFIFVDCYTTWCGPCKMMDRDVYTNDTVANYLNDKFISVKVQMDKTKKDNEMIQRWYKDAITINDTYHVEGYPTLIFLNSDGLVTDHQMGYKDVNRFMTLARAAIQPGKIYNDPYDEYARLIASYKQGIKDFGKYPLMITMSVRVHDDSLCRQLSNELADYMLTLKPKERYIKERIEIWSYFTIPSGSRIFQFFLQDGALIDKVMNQNGYANRLIDKTIWNEFVIPFLTEQAKGSKIITFTGGYLTNAPGQPPLKADSNEADWNKLNEIIRQKFNKDCAERNVLAARIEWYKRHWNYELAAKYEVIQMNKYWKESKTINIDQVNNDGFNAFLYSRDKKVINGFIHWLEKAGIQKSERSGLIDTYANLLYKAGRTNEAIKWEEKAVQLAPTDKEIQEAIRKMKRGEPTYAAYGYLIDPAR